MWREVSELVTQRTTPASSPYFAARAGMARQRRHRAVHKTRLERGEKIPRSSPKAPPGGIFYICGERCPELVTQQTTPTSWPSSAARAGMVLEGSFPHRRETGSRFLVTSRPAPNKAGKIIGTDDKVVATQALRPRERHVAQHISGSDGSATRTTFSVPRRLRRFRDFRTLGARAKPRAAGTRTGSCPAQTKNRPSHGVFARVTARGRRPGGRRGSPVPLARSTVGALRRRVRNKEWKGVPIRGGGALVVGAHQNGRQNRNDNP